MTTLFTMPQSCQECMASSSCANTTWTCTDWTSFTVYNPLIFIAVLPLCIIISWGIAWMIKKYKEANATNK